MALPSPLRVERHVWQGRFKAFPIQHDEHLLTVQRQLKRIALRARNWLAQVSWPQTEAEESATCVGRSNGTS